MYKLEVSVQLTDQSESGNALGEHSLNSGVGEGVAGRGAEAWGKKGRGGGGAMKFSEGSPFRTEKAKKKRHI